MPQLSKEQARMLAEDILASLLDPRQAAESLDRYFALDYVQNVDGESLCLNGRSSTLERSRRPCVMIAPRSNGLLWTATRSRTSI